MKVVDLAEKGKLLVDWAYRNMPVIKLIREEFRIKKPLASLKIGACLHVTPETANLVITLKEGGATVILTASNPLSTKPEVVEYLTKYENIEVLSKPGETNQEYYNNIKKVIESNPNLLIDDGGDLIVTINKEYKTIASKIIGATEETTTGVIRISNLYNEGKLYFPVIAVN
ncbi:MAG: adenosylhomocysteinase, partial [bacterium]